MPTLSDSAVQLLSEQIAREQSASLFYRAAANWTRRYGYRGSNKFFKSESRDELHHRNKLMHYLTGLDEDAPTPPGDAPPTAFPELAAWFTAALAIERENTVAIEEIAKALTAEGDLMTVEFMDQFLRIQRKSITQLITINYWFTRADGDEAALQVVDARVGKKA